jgi:hypothetical protein
MTVKKSFLLTQIYTPGVFVGILTVDLTLMTLYERKKKISQSKQFRL